MNFIIKDTTEKFNWINGKLQPFVEGVKENDEAIPLLNQNEE